jgi:hypothetical protein
MIEDTSSLLDAFFSRYAQAVSSRNPSAFANEHFDRSLLCASDRTLPFELQKADQRVLARSEQQRQARSGRHAVSFEIRDMIGGLPGQMPGHLYVTVAWHLNVRPLALKSGDQVVIGYLLRIEDDKIDILAASVVEGGPESAGPAEVIEEDDEPVSEDGLAAGHRDGGAGHVAG